MGVNGGRPGSLIPENLLAAAREEGREAWLSTIPQLVARYSEEWELTVSAPFQPGGSTAWVAAARTRSGDERVLKILWRHADADHESDGLRVWAGNGAVRMYEVAELPDAIVLLLERCLPGLPLSEAPEPEQDVVVAGLLRRLWVTPPHDHRLRPLTDMCDRWAEQFDIARATGPMALHASLADEGIQLFRLLPRTAEREVLLATDLHAGNVLSAVREPWLAIDPKPYIGDPTYDATQHMFNCERRLHDDPHALIARLADLLDLDRDRLRLWMFARCVQESAYTAELADVVVRLAPT